MRKYLVLAALGAAACLYAGVASADAARAYCWINSKDYYRCYGPTQLIMVGEKDISEPLELSGCPDGRRTSGFRRAGVHGGAWFICRRELEPYHNSPEEIEDWLNSQ